MTGIYICGFCYHYDPDINYCPFEGEVYAEDTCDNWTEEPELSDDELEAIR